MLASWLNQCPGFLLTCYAANSQPTACNCLKNFWGTGGASTPCPGGSGDAESHHEGGRQDWVPALLTLSPFAFQLCVKFIKDTLSVEQVCEALQVSVIPVRPQRVKTICLILGQELARPSCSWLDDGTGFSTHPCRLLGTSLQGPPGSRVTTAWQGNVLVLCCPEQGWPELPSASALPSFV